MEKKKLSLDELTKLYESNPEEFRNYLKNIPSDELFNYGVMYLSRARRLVSEAKKLVNGYFSIGNFYKKFGDSVENHLN